MKFTFKHDSDLDEDEFIITHNAKGPTVDHLYQFLMDQSKESAPLSLYSQDKQYFILMTDILFFETQDNIVYAHTELDAYECNYRLYELEEILSTAFIRISKSTIVNTKKVLSISRYLNSSGVVKFQKSAKEVFVSRKYFQTLKQNLEKRTEL